jgi:hypothetical protein
MTRPLLLAGSLIAATTIAVLALFLAVEKPEAGGAPTFRVAPLGGIQYQTMDGRPISPADRVDRRLIAGLPARDRRLRHGEALFGAFISVANTSTRPLRSADRIELRDDAGHLHRPLPLPRSNTYAYAPRVVRPGATIPSQNSPADENLAATGLLLLFRIDGREYTNGGTFELVIHDPRSPGRTASLIV